jgi:transcription initiation factor IIE alpha subunit
VSDDDDAAPFVCDVCDNPLEYTDQERANARLIAAAPDLLEALELCEDVLARLDDGTPSISALHAARAAIAKATA